MPRSGTTQDDIRRRRATGAKKARLRRFFAPRTILFVLLVAGLSWLAASAAPRRLVAGAEQKIYKASAAKGFAIKNLLVQGRVNIDADILRGLIDVKPGDPILAFDPVKVRDSLRRVPWVKDARVERRLPDTVYVKITERRPLALWQDKGKVRLIDEDGVTLTDSNLQSFASLPLVVGTEAPKHAAGLLRLLAAEPTLAPQVEASSWIGGRRWDLALKNGITVQLPAGDAGLALRRLASAHEENALLEKDIAVIDLREDGRMTVRTKPGAVKELKAAPAPKKSDI